MPDRRSLLRAALIVAASCLAAVSATAATPTPRLKPPAPGPAFIAKNDLERLRLVKDAVERKRFTDARALAGFIEDPAARSLAQWYVLDADDPATTIAEADSWLDAHPEWPSTGKFRTLTERRFGANPDNDAVLAFFATRDPMTAGGKIALARAQYARGEREAADAHIRSAWVNDDMTLAEEQRILALYASALRYDDHVARVDRLLWSREAASARRAMNRLQGADRRRAEVRAALISAGADAARAYDSLGADDRADPGVALAAVRYFRRKEEEPRAILIAREGPTDPLAARNPTRWWEEQQLLMRYALKNKAWADAYAMAAHHALEPGSTQFSEAEFNAGWIALRFLNDPPRAEQHFAALAASVTAPISLARAWYWLGRAAEAKGDAGAAKARYAKAAEFPYTFYGQLAAEMVGGPAAAAAFEESPPATPEEKARFGGRPAVSALRMLTDLGDERAFLIFAYHLDDQLQSRGEFLELADLAMRINAPHVAVRAGKVAVRANAFAPEVAYPMISVPPDATRFAPLEIILGLSRQESEFNPRAYSSAGARGLMQLIPSTAQATAKKEGLPYRRESLLGDPNYNMTIGAAHLSHLVARYDGSWAMTFAAYNAGPHRVSRWIEEYGDPRAADVDPLDWIEFVPFEETRNYIQRVLENTQVYRARATGGSIAGRLSADIARGGSAGRIGRDIVAFVNGVIPDVQPRTAALAAPILAPPPAAPVAAPAPTVKPSGASQTKPSRTRRPPARPRKPQSEAARPLDVAPGETTQAAQAESAPSVVAPTAAAIAATPAPVDATTAPPAPARPFPEPPEAEVRARPAAPLSMQPVGAEPSDAESEPQAPLVESGAAEGGDCVTYSDFIAATAREDANADDLNAGARAELAGGGSACENALAEE